jgi:hypothetical protein
MGLWPVARWDCGFESRWEHGCLSVVSGVCCQAEVSASGWSVVQRSPAEWGVSECDRKASRTRPWPTGAVAPWKEKKYIPNADCFCLSVYRRHVCCVSTSSSKHANSCIWSALMISDKSHHCEFPRSKKPFHPNTAILLKDRMIICVNTTENIQRKCMHQIIWKL